MQIFLARCPSGVKRWTAIVLLALVAGCSSTTFFYNRLPIFVGWYVGDYVTLSREQGVLFDAQLEILLDWHRQAELPQYITLLDSLSVALDDTFTETELSLVYDAFQAAAERLRVKLTAFALEFGDELDHAQRLEFVASIRTNQQEWYEERVDLTADEYVALIEDRFKDNLSDFLGRLNDEQRTLIREQAKRMIPMHEPWHEQRLKWLDRLEQALRDHPENWRAPTQRALDSWNDDQSETYIKLFETNQAISRNLVRAVINLRTPRQDKRLRSAIADYRDDFASLIAVGYDSVQQ